mgnify:CR=1 FL=1
MGYVKISDPNIIDLNAMHNIINVVNQHSDTLNILTNNYGANNNSSVNYNASDLSHLFDSGSQMIIYGRALFDSTSNYDLLTKSSYSPAGYRYYKNVTFSDNTNSVPAFTISTPIVLLTPHTGNTSSSVSNSFSDLVANVYNVTSTSFNIRMFMQEQITGSAKVYINWMAIGPKGK